MARLTGFSPLVRYCIGERSAGRCEICDGWYSDMQMHHRRPRGMGGTRRAETNLASAGLHLCAACHRQVEAYRSTSYDNGWLVRQSGAPGEVPVLRRGVWVRLLDDGSVVPHDYSSIKSAAQGIE